MTALPGPSADTWDALALAGSNIFATREWAECSWRHFGEGEPFVLTDDPEHPRIILPLHRTGRAVRQWKLIGAGPADQLGPACAPEDRDKARELLRTFLAEHRGWDVTVLHDVAAEEGWDLMPGAQEVRRVASPVLALPTDDWDAFLAGRSKNFRDQIRRKRRKLDQQVTSELRMATTDSLARDLDTFFRLHQARWGADAPLAHGTQRAFLVDFVHRAAARGWLRLFLLEVDGVAAAVSLGFRFGDAEYYYQGGRDPDFEHLSVGVVMMGHAVEQAVRTGASEYRLLRGDEGYKSRWSDFDRAVHTVAFSRTVRGRAATRLAAARSARRTAREAAAAAGA